MKPEIEKGWVIVSLDHPSGANPFTVSCSFARTRKLSIALFTEGSTKPWNYWKKKYNFKVVRATRTVQIASEGTSQSVYLEEVQKRIDSTPPDVRGNYSDGYHTFNELYEFRKMYNAALFNEWAMDYAMGSGVMPGPKYDIHKSWRHHDGELCFGGGWFIVVAMLPTGQISNHYKAEDWDLFKIPEKEKALYPFDGHTSQDVIQRLKDLE